jgi:hypothetical protein
LIPILALAFIALTSTLRIERVRYVSGLEGWSAADRPSGLSEWQPRLIIPGNQSSSFEWLDQTRQMLATGEFRIRHIDYENTPSGHDVSSASPYRWWLGLLAWICHSVTGQAFGPSLETAALFADPLLNVLLLIAASGFVAWRFGLIAAALVSVALATLYPLAVGYLPGAPDDQSLSVWAVLWSVLPLLAGLSSRKHQKFWFFIAGAAGGIGLWIRISNELPVILGIGIGSLVAAIIVRSSSREGQANPSEVLPWRTWAGAGAATTLAAFLCEYFPSHLGTWNLQAIHPLYGLAWLGWGQVLATATLLIQRGRPASRTREAGSALLAVAAIAALATAMWRTHSFEFFFSDTSIHKLTRLPNGVESKNFFTLVAQLGSSPLVLGVVLPVLLMGPPLWLLFRRATDTRTRAEIAIAMGPVGAVLVLALFRLNWWIIVDATLVALMATMASTLNGRESPRFLRPACLALAAAAAVSGAVQAWPQAQAKDRNGLIGSEVVGLIERDLARWLVLHAPRGGGVVLAPTDVTMALYYYGGVRGLGTLNWDNRDGLQAVIRIVSATTFDEALDLVDSRGVDLIVIPSWDAQLDTFANIGLGRLSGTFVDGLHKWILPPWLRPMPYPLPVIEGFEGQSVLVLMRTEDQGDALLMSRVADYLVETDNLRMASSASSALKRFPADIGATVARAEVQNALGETDEFSHAMDSLLPSLKGEKERALPWDRRVNLAVALAQGRHLDRARAEMQKCLADLDEDRLRSLSPGALYRFQVLGKILGMEIADPRLHELAINLLPKEMEKRFER